jgi:hypothetical protein
VSSISLVSELLPSWSTRHSIYHYIMYLCYDSFIIYASHYLFSGRSWSQGCPSRARVECSGCEGPQETCGMALLMDIQKECSHKLDGFKSDVSQSKVPGSPIKSYPLNVAVLYWFGWPATARTYQLTPYEISYVKQLQLDSSYHFHDFAGVKSIRD